MMRPVLVTLFVAVASLVLAPVSNAQGVCGDCDQNGTVNVLDSLAAAQIDAGLISPTIDQEFDCDVDNNGAIDLTDATLIAEVAAGLPTTLACPTRLTLETVGYCLVGSINSSNNWEIVVADADPFTSASFTSPPLPLPALQVATVINPTPPASLAAAAAAFITAINGTVPFQDQVNSVPPAPIFQAGFGAVGPPAPPVPPPVGPFSCFTPFVTTMAPVPGSIHFASVGVVTGTAPAPRTVCFPQPGVPCRL